MSWRDIVKAKELTPKQKKLDRNHNGVIDAQDFYIMNGSEDEKKSQYNPASAQYIIDLIGKQRDILEEVDEIVRKIHSDIEVELPQIRELATLNLNQSNKIKLGIISLIETLEGV